MPTMPYTDADEFRVAVAIAETRTDCEPLEPCYSCRASARRALRSLAAAGRLPAPHHLPLLDLTADEVEAIRRALMQRPINAPHVSSALDKLTTTEEGDRA